MAIAHLHVKVIKRSEGRPCSSNRPLGEGSSVVAMAAYRAGEKLRDERYSKTHDYTKRASGVAHSEILLPAGAASWMADRDRLWNEVEKCEKRRDSQLAREIDIALPRELILQDNVELVRDFAQAELVKHGMVADVAVHVHDLGNPHAHILLTTREVTPDGFGKKLRPASDWLSRKDELKRWREQWQEHCNVALVRAGQSVQIDMRSYADQGLDIEPTRHLGVPVCVARKSPEPEREPLGSEPSAPRSRDFERASLDALGVEEAPSSCHAQGSFYPGPVAASLLRKKRDRAAQSARELVRQDAIEEYEKTLVKNGRRVQVDPGWAILAVSKKQATFTRRDLAGWLFSHVSDEHFELCLSRCLSHKNLVHIGYDRDGEKRYSTETVLRQEAELLVRAQMLADRHNHSVSPSRISAASFEQGLSFERELALRHITTNSGDVAVVQGYAGSGKSRMLRAARVAWESEGYRVIGAALAGKAAQELQASSGIQSRTVASLRKSLTSGWESLGAKDVLVLDEGGMIGTGDLGLLVGAALRGGAKVVISGDTRQLQAVDAGSAMCAVADLVGEVTISEVLRQSDAWQRDASEKLGSGRTAEGIESYMRAGCFSEHGLQSEAVEAMVSRWYEAREKNPEASRIMLAYRNVDVRAANELARSKLVAAGQVGSSITAETSVGIREFGAGDQVVFLKRDRKLEIENGTLGVVEKVDGTQRQMVVRVGGESGGAPARQVTVELSQYGYIDHGYAVTLHRSQGATYDEVSVLASRELNAAGTYVGLTRHRSRLHVHWSQEVFENRQALVQMLSRKPETANALDFAAEQSTAAAVSGLWRGPGGSRVGSGKRQEEAARRADAERLDQLGRMSAAELEQLRAAYGKEADRELQRPQDRDENYPALVLLEQRARHAHEKLEPVHKRWLELCAANESQPALVEAAKRGEGPEAELFAEYRRVFAAREKRLGQLEQFRRDIASQKTAQRVVEDENRHIRNARRQAGLVDAVLRQRRIEELNVLLDKAEAGHLQQLRDLAAANAACRLVNADGAGATEAPADAEELAERVREVRRLEREVRREVSGLRWELSELTYRRDALFAQYEPPELGEDERSLGAAARQMHQHVQQAAEQWQRRVAEDAEQAHAARLGAGPWAEEYQGYAQLERKRLAVLSVVAEKLQQIEIRRLNEELNVTEGRYLDALGALRRAEVKAGEGGQPTPDASEPPLDAMPVV